MKQVRNSYTGLILLLLIILSIFIVCFTSSNQLNDRNVDYSSIEKIFQKFLTKNPHEEVRMNVSFGGPFFDGYNLFVLNQQSRDDPTDRRATLIITDMNGCIFTRKEIVRGYFPIASYPVEFINSTTLLIRIYQKVTLWNFYKNISRYFNIHGHHEFEYNPFTNTFLTLKRIDILNESDGIIYANDEILEYDNTGEVIWSLNTSSFIHTSQWCPYYDMFEEIADLTHGNSLFWDIEKDFIYFNSRNVNTFYKIDHKTGKVIWGLGEYGNFSLFDKHGNEKANLFYHAHAVEKIDNNTFILFDNDYHNQTNPRNFRSRIVEIQINETTMTANESWSWTAPQDYYSNFLGDADKLPNYNRLGTFGSSIHPNNSIGARLVEVDQYGEIVWELNFPNNEDFNYGIYRMERFRFSPVLSQPADIFASENDTITVTWQTWYNLRLKRYINGIYSLFLDDEQVGSGTHVFNKFWQSTIFTYTNNDWSLGSHNLTLIISDEGGHKSVDSVNITIVPLFSNISVLTSAFTTTRANYSIFSVILGLVIIICNRISKKEF